MEILLFIVMAPFYLLLGFTWIVSLVKDIQWRLWCRDLERKSEEAARIEAELKAKGMPWAEALYKARCQAFGYEEQ